jgi:Flp pilus assembly protein TadB
VLRCRYWKDGTVVVGVIVDNEKETVTSSLDHERKGFLVQLITFRCVCFVVVVVVVLVVIEDVIVVAVVAVVAVVVVVLSRKGEDE